MERSDEWLDKSVAQLGTGRHGSAAFLSEEILCIRVMSNGYVGCPIESATGRDMAQHATASWPAAVCSNCWRRAEGMF